MKSIAIPSPAGFAAVAAAATWLVSWLLNTATLDDTVRVLGLTEGNYRSFLNPALVLLIVADLAILRWGRQAGGRRISLGAGLIALGLGAMLVGNVIEFGLDGTLRRAKDAGFAVFLIGYMAFIPVGGIFLVRRSAPGLSALERVGAGLLVGVPIVLALPLVAHILFATGWGLIGIGMVRRVTFADAD